VGAIPPRAGSGRSPSRARSRRRAHRVLTDHHARQARGVLTLQAAGCDVVGVGQPVLESLVDMTVAGRVTDIVTRIGLSPARWSFRWSPSRRLRRNLGNVLEIPLAIGGMKGCGLRIYYYGNGLYTLRMQRLTRIPFTEREDRPVFVAHTPRRRRRAARCSNRASRWRPSSGSRGRRRRQTQAHSNLLASLVMHPGAGATTCPPEGPSKVSRRGPRETGWCEADEGRSAACPHRHRDPADRARSALIYLSPPALSTGIRSCSWSRVGALLPLV